MKTPLSQSSLISKYNLSLWSIILISIVILIRDFDLRKWENKQVIVSDGKVYYAYLPATFIFNDLKFDFSSEYPEIFGTTWRTRAENQNKVVKMSMGNAILWLPFFQTAHLYMKISGQTSTGYEAPYHLAIAMATVIYLILGLLILRKLLLKYARDEVVALSLLIVVMGSNLYYYTVYESAMSHVNNFFLINLFLYSTDRWLDQPDKWMAILAGSSIGLITLIRPVNIIITLFPILVLFFTPGTLKTKFSFIGNNATQLLLMLFLAFLFFMPQLLYWKIITRHWLFYSYMNEGFFFNNPHVFQGILGFRKGWLIYSPVMALSIIGVVFMKGKLAKMRFPLVLTMLLIWYIIFSWWCWWYGGSFGSRVMVDFYGLLSLPMVSFLSFIMDKGWYLKATAGVLIVAAIYINQFQTIQYSKGILHYDGMNWNAYQSIFLETKAPANFSELITRPDYNKALKGSDD